MKKLLLTTLILGATGVAFGAETGKVLYELVPNVVVPDTISYRPSAKNQETPSSFGVSSNYPASYVPYPSYYLPYPTSFRPIQNIVYPITTLPDDATFASAPSEAATQSVVDVPARSVPQTSVIASVERKQSASPIRLVSASEADIVSCEGNDAKEAATSIQQTASAWSFSSPVFKIASVPTPAIGAQTSTLNQSSRLGGTQLNVPPGIYDVPLPLPYNQCSFGTRCGDMPPHQCPVRTCIAQRVQAKRQQEQELYQMQLQYYQQQQYQHLQQYQQPVQMPQQLPMQFPQQSAGAPAPLPVPVQVPGAAQQTAVPQVMPQVTYTATPVMTPYGMAMVMQPQWAPQPMQQMPQPAAIPMPPQALPAPAANPATANVATDASVGANAGLPNAGGDVNGVAAPQLPPQFPYPPMMQGAMMQGAMMQGGYPMMGAAPNSTLTPYDIALLVSLLKSNSRRDAMRERRAEKHNAAAQSTDPLSIFMQAWGTPTPPSGVTARMPSKTAYPWGYFGGQSGPQSTANFGGYYNNTFHTTTQPGM